jgi:hypothetical protein
VINFIIFFSLHKHCFFFNRWETQISLKGNKAEVWQQLIDNKKLPFMAMLRNLRNMIKAGMYRKRNRIR